jgi:hypothetical protein
MVKWSADRFGGADVVLIEAEASGLDVINELRRLYDQGAHDLLIPRAGVPRTLAELATLADVSGQRSAGTQERDHVGGWGPSLGDAKQMSRPSVEGGSLLARPVMTLVHPGDTGPAAANVV